jgi:regulator of sirC expression with transglutaminase-like and TPR domain
MLPESEIQALVRLLDDDDREVLKHVYTKIKSFGVDIIPSLENASATELNPLQHDRLEEIIHDIQFEIVSDELTTWVDSEDQDLMSGFYIISKYFFPDLKLDEVQKQISKIKQSIWLELNYNQTPLEQIQIFNQIFYGYHGFSGVQLSEKFEHYCLNNLLSTKYGSSIALGLLYQIIARELNLPVYGVPLVKYYVVCFCKRSINDFNPADDLEREIMFYINPVNRGSLFSRNEIKEYLEKMKIGIDAKFFSPANNKTLIAELITYFIELSALKNIHDKEADLHKLYHIVTGQSFR